MKRIYAALMLLAFTACTKNNADDEFGNSDKSITGKWTEYENYISPGTPWQWQAASNITVQINNDLTYTTTNDSYFWGKSGKIENLTDSSFLLNSSVLNSMRTCYYKINNGVLEVWYPCIEGCGSRFKRKTNSN